MSDFLQALSALGINPATAGRSARPSDYGYVPTPPVRRGPAGRPGRPVVGAPASVPTTGAGASAGKPWANAPKLDLKDADSWKPTESQDDDGFGLGNMFKKAGLSFLDAIDTPRAFVTSGVKELTDTLYGSRVGSWMDDLAGVSDAERQENLERMGTGSWNDFLNQTRDNIGFRDVLDVVSPETKGKGGVWSVVGFAGDVGLDPTAWVTLGTATAAKAAATGTMRQAVADGGGRALAKELAQTASEKGLRDLPGVERLVADAYQRGRGAITPRGLARNNIDNATREALGIPTLARTIGKDGVRIPGSRVMANAVEDLKGSIKAPFKRSGATSAALKLAPNPLGKAKIARTLASKAATDSKKFDAALALGEINKPLATARSWASDTIRAIERNPALSTSARLGRGDAKKLKALSKAAGIQMTQALESGATDNVIANEVRGILQKIRQDAIEFGVDVGDLGPNYVPHMLTDDFRALARKNPEAARIVMALESQVGLQRSRRFGVLPNQDNVFLGEVLETGTIEELNGISMKKLGVNVFVDDVRDVMPRYVEQMSKAIARAQQVKGLVDRGLITDQAVKLTREAIEDTPEEKAVLQAAKDTLKAAREDELVALRDGTMLRRKQLDGVKTAVKARHAELTARLNQVESKLKRANRDLNKAKATHLRLKDQQAAARQALDEWRKVVRSERGAARRNAQQEIKKLEARLREIDANIEKNGRVVQKIMSDRTISLPDRALASQTPQRAFQAWRNETSRIQAEISELSKTIQEISALRAGDGKTAADLRVRRATTRLADAKVATKGGLDDVKAATLAIDGAMADVKVVKDEVDGALVRLDMILDKASGGVGTKGTMKNAITEVDAQDLRDRLQVISRLLAGDAELTDVGVMMAKHEAMAAVADAAALASRSKQAEMEDLINLMGTKRFHEIATPYVEKGMIEIGETMQIPGWLDEALKVEAILPNMLEANKFVRWFYNQWKGYAILRPGFHVRNAYSAMFNVYLEAGAGALGNIKRAVQFDRLAREHPDDYLARAASRWGDEEAAMLNDAYSAMRGSGAGQTAGEFTTSEFQAGTKINPLSKDFALLKSNRRAGESIERTIRAAHAYDVLKRGGNLDQAVDVVNKWHFNYTDVSSFDRAMRISVMPFWMFFSRNMALQGQTWFRSAARLNRAYVNAQRNLSREEEEDRYAPEWFSDAGAIRIGGLDSEGNQMYLFPDLPAAQAPALFDKFTEPWTGQFLGDVGPVKTPFELVSNKQFFSGIPFQGRRGPTEAGLVGQALGSLGLGGQGGLLPRSADGTQMIDDRLQYVINSLIPGAAVVDRLAGQGGASNAERQGLSQLAWLTGVGLRENNERTRRGEQYRQMQEQQLEEQRQRSLGF